MTEDKKPGFRPYGDYSYQFKYMDDWVIEKLSTLGINKDNHMDYRVDNYDDKPGFLREMSWAERENEVVNDIYPDNDELFMNDQLIGVFWINIRKNENYHFQLPFVVYQLPPKNTSLTTGT